MLRRVRWTSIICGAAQLYRTHGFAVTIATRPSQNQVRWVVCPLEGLGTPSPDWIIPDPWMAHNPTTITWQGIHLDGPGPDRARLDEFVQRLFDVLQDEFGRIEPGRVDIESNESLKRLIDELQEETGMKITRVEIEQWWGPH